MIKKILDNKTDYMELLLLADPEEHMIYKYLSDSDMFAIFDKELISIAVVKILNRNEVELKNLATYEQYQNKGYAKQLVNYLADYYEPRYQTMYVGTGDSRMTLNFYKSCGFEHSHVIKNFFVDNYNSPIFEDGKQLIDMIYLKKDLEI